MPKREKKLGPILRRIAKVFGLLLAVLTTLSIAPYPFRAETLVPVYRVDADQANNLASILTLIGFAVCVVVAAFLGHRNRIWVRRRSLGTTALFGWSGVVLLTVCVLGLIENAVFARKSVCMAAAVAVAEERKGFDLGARNAAQLVHDESRSVEDRYRSANEFIETEQLPRPSTTTILRAVEHAPLQEAVFVTYVATLCTFKLGLFAMACALYVWSEKKR